MDGVRYFVLGVTEARSQDGTVLPLGGAKVRAVLTALATQANRPVAPETLIAEVWTEDPPADAAGALQALIARLRRRACKPCGTVSGVVAATVGRCCCAASRRITRTSSSTERPLRAARSRSSSRMASSSFRIVRLAMDSSNQCC